MQKVNAGTENRLGGAIPTILERELGVRNVREECASKKEKSGEMEVGQALDWFGETPSTKLSRLVTSIEVQAEYIAVASPTFRDRCPYLPSLVHPPIVEPRTPLRI